jgi:hypothetical protein
VEPNLLLIKIEQKMFGSTFLKGGKVEPKQLLEKVAQINL